MSALEEWLSQIYAADKQGDKEKVLTKFMAILVSDFEMQRAASTRLKELDELIAARGEKACAYSTKYRKYLKEALG